MHLSDVVIPLSMAATVAVAEASIVPAMGPKEMVVWSVVGAGAGGIAWSVGQAHVTLASIAAAALNTAIMGAAIAAIGFLWSEGSAGRSWAVVGIGWLISLGGMTSVRWIIGLFKGWAEARAKK